MLSHSMHLKCGNLEDAGVTSFRQYSSTGKSRRGFRLRYSSLCSRVTTMTESHSRINLCYERISPAVSCKRRVAFSRTGEERKSSGGAQLDGSGEDWAEGWQGAELCGGEKRGGVLAWGGDAEEWGSAESERPA